VRGVVQRVAWAAVAVEGEEVGRIGAGHLLLVGCTHGDDVATAGRLADKVAELRVLEDDQGRMGRGLVDVDDPQCLVVSQFTLYADTSRGRRPSWLAAAPGDVAEPLVEAVAARLRERGCRVATGRFGADMRIAMEADGPVTILLEV
jgi:D-tyrosyl-tRNA(Tyr) deacylase